MFVDALYSCHLVYCSVRVHHFTRLDIVISFCGVLILLITFAL